MIDRGASVRCIIYMRPVYARGGVMSPWLWRSRGGCVSAGDEVVRKARDEGARGWLFASVSQPASTRRCGGDRPERERRPAGGPGTGRMRWGGRKDKVDLEATRERARACTADARCKSAAGAGARRWRS